MSEKLNFVQAMRKDMERKEMSEAAVGTALGISQQAVHKWLDRGFPPLSRVGDLHCLFGAQSELAKLSHEDLFGEGKVARTPSPHRVAESAPPYGNTDSVITLVGLMRMLPPDPALRARVLRDCVKIVSAALADDE